MKMKERQVNLKNGTQVALRSLTEEESDKLLAFMQKAYAETEFTGRTAKDVAEMTAEQAQEIIVRYDRGKKGIMFCAFSDDEIIANCSVSPVSNSSKEAHRATFGICVRQDFCNLGLGSEILKIAIDFCVKVGYEQIEADSVSQNAGYVMLLNKFEFQPVASLPRAQKLESGEYRDYFRFVKYLV